MALYDSVYFIDNDQLFIDQVSMCPRIVIEKVDGIEGYPPLVPMPPDAEFADKLSDEAKFAMTFFTYSDGKKDTYDRISGIRDTHIARILDWAATEGRKAILIDFDRTISLFEGIKLFPRHVLLKNSYPQPELAPLTVNGYIEYLVGGTERLRMLQDLFSNLYALNIDIFILTNNSVCITNPIGFDELVKVISQGRPVNYICSKASGGNKHAAIITDPRFATVCQASSGGKRRTIRRRKNKRKTRRHIGVPFSRHAARRL
jgi:hypothetical protein